MSEDGLGSLRGKQKFEKITFTMRANIKSNSNHSLDLFIVMIMPFHEESSCNETQFQFEDD